MLGKIANGIAKFGIAMLVLAAMTASPGFAQKKGETLQEPKMPPPVTEQTVTVSGQVTEISGASLTVTDGQKTAHTIGLGPNTKITKAGKDVPFAEIKANDPVVVVASKGTNDALTAVSIAVG